LFSGELPPGCPFHRPSMFSP